MFNNSLFWLFGRGLARQRLLNAGCEGLNPQALWSTSLMREQGDSASGAASRPHFWSRAPLLSGPVVLAEVGLESRLITVALESLGPVGDTCFVTNGSWDLWLSLASRSNNGAHICNCISLCLMISCGLGVMLSQGLHTFTNCHWALPMCQTPVNGEGILSSAL